MLGIGRLMSTGYGGVDPIFFHTRCSTDAILTIIDGA